MSFVILSVVSPGGSHVEISNLSLESPLSILKARVAASSGVPVAQQLLLMDEAILKCVGEDATLGSLGIMDGTVLTLIRAQCPLSGVWKGSGDERGNTMELELDCSSLTWVAADQNLLSFKIKYTKARNKQSVIEVYAGTYNAEDNKIRAFGQYLEPVGGVATSEELDRVRSLKSMSRFDLITCIHHLFDADMDGRLNEHELAEALAPYGLGDARGLCQSCGWDETLGPTVDELCVAFATGGPFAKMEEENLRGYIMCIESKTKFGNETYEGWLITGNLDVRISEDTLTIVYNEGATRIELQQI